MSTGFEFFTIVRIINSSADIQGQEGVVLGKAQNEAGIWSYAVSLYSTNTTWSFTHNELEDTGRKDKAENFYDGSSIRVSQKGEIKSVNISDSDSDSDS
jgi:hypothetical protein